MPSVPPASSHPASDPSAAFPNPPSSPLSAHSNDGSTDYDELPPDDGVDDMEESGAASRNGASPSHPPRSSHPSSTSPSRPPPPKARKPYTVSKPRETWTQSEHTKFIEALSLFERDWKRIGAHIGTKTIIQIRSHAQKYFIKMQKMGLDTYIPPPRPKRKSRRGASDEDTAPRGNGQAGDGDPRPLLPQAHTQHPPHVMHAQPALLQQQPLPHALAFHPHPTVASLPSLSMPHAHAHAHPLPMQAQAIAAKPAQVGGGEGSMGILSSLSQQMLAPPPGMGHAHGLAPPHSPSPYGVYDPPAPVLYQQAMPLQGYHPPPQQAMHGQAMYPQAALHPLPTPAVFQPSASYAGPLSYPRGAAHLQPPSLASPQSARASSPALAVHSPGGFPHQQGNVVPLQASRASPFVAPAPLTHIRPTPTRPSPIITHMNEGGQGMGGGLGVKEEKREESREKDRGGRDGRDGHRERREEREGRDRRHRRERDREREREEEKERERRAQLSKRRDSYAVMEDVSKTLALLKEGALAPLDDKRGGGDGSEGSGGGEEGSSDSSGGGSDDERRGGGSSRRHKRARKEKRKSRERRNGRRSDGHRRRSRSAERRPSRAASRDARRRSPPPYAGHGRDAGDVAAVALQRPVGRLDRPGAARLAPVAAATDAGGGRLRDGDGADAAAAVVVADVRGV